MKLASSIFFLFLLSCSDYQSKSTNRLGGLQVKNQTLELEYISWGCACANWAKPTDIEKFYDTGDSLADSCTFLEPSDTNLILPDSIGYSADRILVTGQFYKEKGYPKNFEETEEPIEKARVFRYTSYKILKSNYRDFLIDTLK